MLPAASAASCVVYVVKKLTSGAQYRRIAGTGDMDRFASVVKIDVTGAEPSYTSPWKVGTQREWGGSGFAIPQHRQLLTNHHGDDCHRLTLSHP